MDVTVKNPSKETRTLAVNAEEFTVKPGTNVLKPKHPQTTHRHVADAVATQLGVHGVETVPEKGKGKSKAPAASPAATDAAAKSAATGTKPSKKTRKK